MNSNNMSEKNSPLNQSQFINRFCIFLEWVSAITLAIFAVIISIMIYQTLASKLRLVMESRSLVIADSIQIKLQRPLQFGVQFQDLKSVNQFLEDTSARHSNLKYIFIADLKGKILFKSTVSPSKKVFKYIHHIQKSTFLKALDKTHFSKSISGFYHTVVPFYSKNKFLGLIHIGFEEKEVKELFDQAKSAGVLVFSASMFILFMILKHFSSIHISLPSQSIILFLKKGYQQKDFRHSLELQGHSDLSQLGNAVNKMVEEISDRYQSLVEKSKWVSIYTAHSIHELERALFHFLDYRFSKGRKYNRVQKDDVSYMRTPLFLFSFAEELSRPFLPLYSETLYTPIFGWSQKFVIGLPIIIFMAVIAVITPIAGSLLDKYGCRKTLLLGIIPSILGFAGSIVADGIYEFIVARALSGLGYGLFFVAAQGYFANYTTEENKATAMGQFITTVITAGFCGVAIGGILSEEIGYARVFIVSLVLTFLATYLILREFPEKTLEPNEKKTITFRGLTQLVAHSQFSRLLFFSTIPAKAVLTGFLFYLVPLYLQELGNSQGEIGRNMVGFSFIIIIGTRAVNYIADRFKIHHFLVYLGSILTSIGLISLYWYQSSTAIVLSILTLGFAYTCSSSTQMAIASEIYETSLKKTLGKGQVFSTFRLFDRVGSILGPLLAALFYDLSGGSYPNAIGLIGLCVFVTGNLFYFWRPKEIVIE
ncbi:MAG: putative MFS family arabinose efflux permease [bacterium]|jgi:predicted MFS family arabinose efflux permease